MRAKILIKWTLWLSAITILTGCVLPADRSCSLGLQEFIEDSALLSNKSESLERPQQLTSPLACLDESENDKCENLEDKEENCHPDTMIQEGDLLSIVLYCPSRNDRVLAIETIEKQAGFRVFSGKILLPPNLSVEVAGCTLSEAKELLQRAYRKQIGESQIFINFKKKQERFVFLIGAQKPRIAIQGTTKLSQVLAEAGLLPSSNLSKSYIVRDEKKLPVNFDALITRGDETQNILVRGGDQIFIANTSTGSALVTGEVPRPSFIALPHGSICLKEALAIAGGIPFTARKNCIQVIRGSFSPPKIYHLSWKELCHTENASLLLIEGDIVVLSEKPITEWNRYIEQLQPSTGCIQTALSIYNTARLVK